MLYADRLQLKQRFRVGVTPAHPSDTGRDGMWHREATPPPKRQGARRLRFGPLEICGPAGIEPPAYRLGGENYFRILVDYII